MLELSLKLRSWLNTNNSWIETKSKYNSYGNLIEATDPKGNQSQIEYDATFNCYPIKTRTGVPDPSGNSGSSTAFETTATYDTLTGLPLTTTDANGQVTQIQYNDPLLRPTRVIPPSGGAVSEMIYNDTPGAMWVKTRTQVDGTNWKEAIAFADGLGRTIRTQSIDNQGDVFTEAVYDVMGRAYLSSNPYRNGETKYWTQTNFDVAGRAKEIITPDGAKVQTSYDVSTSGMIGTVVTVTDQANKQRRSITNALGQLMRVDEPDDNGNLGSVASPTQATNYSYDTLSNLVQVNQGVQQRNFSYNSLSRLLSATNPESGTINYGYDNSGNLTQKTDARGVVTNYVYDNLNRAISRTYNDGTPSVTYKYDNLTFAKGKLIQVASAISTTNYNNFDNLGRILNSQQITDGQTYNFGYSYNLSGALVNETYPSGRIITNQFESDGDLAQVNGSFQGNNKTYVGNLTYTSAGAVSSLQLGNGKWENTTFNARLQPVQIGLGSSANAQDLWKVNYDYGTTDNNGNVKSQQITVPSQFTAIQNYSYDSLYRLKSANETISGNQTWKQTFTFDRYGNRKFDASQTTTLGNCPVNVCNPDISATNNRVTTHQFDNSGNTTIDAEGKTFFYDAENKQKEVRDASNNIIGQYLYDGDGKRVKKISANDTTIFVYDAGGKLASEYLITASQSQAPTTSFLTNDTLGSPRVVTDNSGNVTSRRDFRPYGEEIYRAGQGTDKVRQKFTSYERDNETDLDFAQARMYNKNLGRFNSVDPLMASAKTANPQTFNRYNYVGNNPINLTDPLGLDWYYNGESYRWSADGKTFKNGDEVGSGWKSVVGSSGNGSFVYEGGGGWVSLNPYGNNWTVSDTQESATKTFDGRCANCQALANSIAEQAEIKGKVVGTLAVGAVVVGTGAGIAMAATGTVIGGTVTTLGLTEAGAGAATTAATVAAANPDKTAQVLQGISNTFNHIFGQAEHNLGSFVNQFGSREKAFDAVQQAANQALKSGNLVIGKNGVLPNGNAGNIINVGGTSVRLIGGRVVDGTVQISSFSRKGL